MYFSNLLLVHTKANGGIADALYDLFQERQIRITTLSLRSNTSVRDIQSHLNQSDLTILITSSRLLSSPVIEEVFGAHIQQKKSIIAVIINNDNELQGIIPITTLFKTLEDGIGLNDIDNSGLHTIYEIISQLNNPDILDRYVLKKAIRAHEMESAAHYRLSETIDGIFDGPRSQTKIDISGITVAEKRTEKVEFTQFYPSTILAHEETSIRIYVHISAAIDQVLHNFAQYVTSIGDYEKISQKSSLPFFKGTRFTIIPFFENAKVSPTSADVIWVDDVESITFQIKPTESAEKLGFVKGELRILVGPLIVAVLSINMRVVSSSHTSAKVNAASALQFNKLFISYSHDDESVIRVVDKIYGKHPEIETFIDYKFLKSGQLWSPKIQEKIREADALQLFWSPSASKSKPVEDEWRYALALSKHILPVIFGRPKPEIPPELGKIHFEELSSYIDPFLD